MEFLLTIAVPFFLSLILTPVIKKISVPARAYARENKRTVHHGKISRIGGIAIYTAFAVSMALFVEPDRSLQGVFAACSLMFFTGLWDDFFDMKPFVKMIFQFLAASILIFFGIRTDALHLPFGIVIDNTWVSFLFTVIWVIGITNAVNLTDGLDGLAGGMSLVVFSIVLSISLVDHRPDMVSLSLIICGALLGFLVYNAHPASIFMGDCGSLFLGCLIASTSLLGFKSSTVLTLALPILILLLPIIDTLSAIARRKIKGESFSTADRSHLHHQLLKRFGHEKTVIIMCGITFLFGLAAFLYIYNKKAGILLILMLLLLIEIFIERTGMISRNYRPVLGLLHRILSKSAGETADEKTGNAKKTGSLKKAAAEKEKSSPASRQKNQNGPAAADSESFFLSADDSGFLFDAEYDSLSSLPAGQIDREDSITITARTVLSREPLYFFRSGRQHREDLSRPYQRPEPSENSQRKSSDEETESKETKAAQPAAQKKELYLRDSPF